MTQCYARLLVAVGMGMLPACSGGSPDECTEEDARFNAIFECTDELMPLADLAYWTRFEGGLVVVGQAELPGEAGEPHVYLSLFKDDAFVAEPYDEFSLRVSDPLGEDVEGALRVRAWNGGFLFWSDGDGAPMCEVEGPANGSLSVVSCGPNQRVPGGPSTRVFFIARPEGLTPRVVFHAGLDGDVVSGDATSGGMDLPLSELRL